MEKTKPYIIAGPCSAETREQVLRTAHELKKAGANAFRSGLWKPRTKPGTFEGVGRKGIEWLRAAMDAEGIPAMTEVAEPEHIQLCHNAGIVIMWIGARTTANPFAVQALADAIAWLPQRSIDGLEILIKNPICHDIELWCGAVERIRKAGVKHIGLIYRGIQPKEKGKYRNSTCWDFASEMKRRYPDLPFYVDPSHIAGQREYVKEISQAAIAFGADGLMIESHIAPDTALSDARQQIEPKAVNLLLEELKSHPSGEAANLVVERGMIEEIDREILGLLSKRAEVSLRVAENKRAAGTSIIQPKRWEELLTARLEAAKELGLHEQFIQRLFGLIHDYSVEAQVSQTKSE